MTTVPESKAMSEAEMEARLHGICFKNGPPRRIGVELEWLVHPLHDPARPVGRARLHAAAAALRDLPLRSALTFEPGGQVELSSLPADSLTDCVTTTAADLAQVRAALARLGLGLAGHGHDPWHPPRRVLATPRYDSMETALDRSGPAGRYMMCSTASVQVCLDAGDAGPGPLGLRRRWRLAHLLGAVLTAAFANSPLARGKPSGYRSTRQARWAAMDPDRVLAPAAHPDPRRAWTRHVLDAPVMAIRADAGPWTVPERLTLREWARSGSPRPPTGEDLDLHVSTLFPPVRPRGHLELRMIDAQPGENGWVVPLAVTTALFDDPRATETAQRAVAPLARLAGSKPAPCNPLWHRAARDALTDPALHAAAVTCFAAAREALPRLAAGPAVVAAVADFTAHYVVPGRCPADDLLDPRTGKDTP